ncbi:MAG: thioredoxin [Clostridia bacterium]|nr:thioredoxin [Clostridia bacterium]
MAEITITGANFRQEVLDSDLPVLIDLWAAWCGPCKMLSPIISDIADEYEGRIKVGKINVDDEPDLAAQFRVMNIPMVVIVKDKKVVETSIGYKPKEQIAEMIDRIL